MLKQQPLTTAKIGFYPAFTDINVLRDYFTRARWYLPEQSGTKLMIPVTDKSLTNSTLLSRDLNPACMTFTTQPNNIKLCVTDTPENHSALYKEIDIVALWKAPPPACPVFKSFSETGKIVERVYSLHADCPALYEYPNLLERLQTNSWKNNDQEIVKSRFNNIIQNLKHKYSKTYVIGTGPSLQQVRQMDLSDGVRIVCNSIVRNKELLKHIKPHFIIASDSVHHFGFCKYSELFRRDLFDALDLTGAYFVFPEPFRSLIYSHYPSYINRCLPIPDVHTSNINLNLLNSFCFKYMPNVIPHILIPLASTISNEVYIIGCDGRASTDTFFWKHDSASQYNDLLPTIKQCHPDFIPDENYENYFKDHCANMDMILSSGESIGIRYISTTNSTIPALMARKG